MTRLLLFALFAPASAHAQTLTVYSSLPLSGAAASQTKAVNDGARQALQETGGMAGGQAIKFVTLNDATRRAGSWVPERVARNAREVAGDATAVALIGAFNSGTMRACKRVVAVDDKEVYGAGVGEVLRTDLARFGVKVRRATISRRTRSFRAITRSRPDCVAYTGITANGAVRMFRAAPKRAKLFGSDGVAESGFTRRLPASVARRMTVTVTTLAPDAYPGGAIIGNGDPYKIYGYEAMKLILDGLNTAGPSRAALLGWLQTGVQNRASVLGTYSLDANGDTTLRTYGLYGVAKKVLVWKSAITAG